MGRTVRVIVRTVQRSEKKKLPERGVLSVVLDLSTADCPVQNGGPSASGRPKTLSVGLVLCKSGQVYCGPSAPHSSGLSTNENGETTCFWEGSGTN